MNQSQTNKKKHLEGVIKIIYLLLALVVSRYSQYLAITVCLLTLPWTRIPKEMLQHMAFQNLIYLTTLYPFKSSTNIAYFLPLMLQYMCETSEYLDQLRIQRFDSLGTYIYGISRSRDFFMNFKASYEIWLTVLSLLYIVLGMDHFMLLPMYLIFVTLKMYYCEVFYKKYFYFNQSTQLYICFIRTKYIDPWRIRRPYFFKLKQ